MNDSQDLNFGQALEALVAGKAVTREAWNGPHYLQLQTPDENSKMKRPYIFITPHGDQSETIPWVASQADLLANDWAIVLKP